MLSSFRYWALLLVVLVNDTVRADCVILLHGLARTSASIDLVAGAFSARDLR